MTTTYTKKFLSASTNGRRIQVNGTTTGSATTLHTATSTSASFDEVWLWGTNISSGPITIFVQEGGTTSADGKPVPIPNNAGDYQIMPGYVFGGGVVVSAYVSGATNAGYVTIGGFANNIT